MILDDGTVLTQSLAIIDYLDATYPDAPLIPPQPLLRSRVLAAALIVATDIHPLNNLRVVSALKSRLDATPEDTTDWMLHWMAEGFAALEALLSDTNRFAFTNTPTLADLCIVSQVYNANRWGLSHASFRRITRIDAACLAIPEIAAAAP